ncbi:FMN-dependent NADH-azoreductase [Thalassomonas actiniarum]|uniref:FMN dependent NADH:quinone oxidoreductase n=1 Tax=Thalassomonas actiniarum TaxID=485447 RepID=A0AAE9YIY6_9GAMM|nr:NAD(P)H-dependent oxidoreductase [Thalassomonas actiniarum]WDD96795.1 NAD(P)H-dependent oxidoreductase [Thalassomonas actiniarum]
MSKILVLNTGLNGEQSNSTKFTQMYLDVRKSSGLVDEVSVRDLNNEQLPHLSAQEMQAWMTPPEQQTVQQQQLAKLSDELIDELMAHDIVVIGMPMYNLGVPSTFKAYIDRIARAGKTFSYTENGPQGLVKNTKVVVLAARGGMYQGTPMDTQTGFIKGIYGLMGISEVDFIYAEGLNMGEEVAEKAWLAANEQLEQTV